MRRSEFRDRGRPRSAPTCCCRSATVISPSTYRTRRDLGADQRRRLAPPATVNPIESASRVFPIPRGAYSMLRLFSGKIGCNSISRGGMSRLTNCSKLSGSNTARPIAPFHLVRSLGRVLLTLWICLSELWPNTRFGRYPLASVRRTLNMSIPLLTSLWSRDLNRSRADEPPSLSQSAGSQYKARLLQACPWAEFAAASP